jgi:hypothetical protein
MVELRFEAEIRASAERVFSLLAERWLPKSSAFHGTVAISEVAAAVGCGWLLN